MDRREFVKAGVAASLATTLPAAAEPAKKKQPNVLYVFSDQHRAASLPGEPFNEAHAPNIDAFRHANFSMDTCVTNYPLCTPYRGILMTGKYPPQSGLVNNGLTMNPAEVTLTKTFKAAGYHTGYVGKWHLGGGEKGGFVPKGPYRFDIDDWHIWDQTNNHYHSWTYDPDTGKRINPEGWSPIPMTDQAGDFLKARTAEPDKPWLLMVSWNPPHPPFDPPAADQAPYAAALKRRPNVIVPSAPAQLHSDDSLHAAMQGYYGGITGVDAEFGRLLKMLDDSGMAENTIVIYTADHGEMMGSQGRMSKQVPFEESCRVPFSVRYPGVTQKSGASKALFAAIDIYPTVCGLAGLAVPHHCEGHDLSGIMRGHKVDAPEIVFLMNGAGDHQAHRGAGRPHPNAHGPMEDEEEGTASHQGKAPIYRGCRTNTHTYAVVDTGRWLLFDNVADPYQTKNLAHDPAHTALMASLDTQIRAWLKHTGDPFPYPAVLAAAA